MRVSVWHLDMDQPHIGFTYFHQVFGVKLKEKKLVKESVCENERVREIEKGYKKKERGGERDR